MVKLWILVHYNISWVLSIPREIYCHQMNFRFWNHNRFESGGHRFRGKRAARHLYFVSRHYKLASWNSLTTEQSSPCYIQILFNAESTLVFFRFMKTVWISALHSLYTHPLSWNQTEQDVVFFILFSKFSSLMRTKQYRLQKIDSFNFILRRGLTPTAFITWIFRNQSNLSDLQSAWNSCYFLLANVCMLEQVTTAEEINFSSCSVWMLWMAKRGPWTSTSSLWYDFMYA